MTGLADAYSNDFGALQSRTRLQAGLGLLALGTVLGLLALVVALANPTEWGARRVAGALGGLAAPAIAGGVVVILPANVRLRAAAAIGASLTLLGVTSFWHAYPEHWLGHGDRLTPFVTGVYFLGLLTIAGCLFAGIATFKRRNDPGGTVSFLIGAAETRVVEVPAQTDSGSDSSPSGSAMGGVGVLGGTPDGGVETQTNGPDPGPGGVGSGSSGGSSDASSADRDGGEILRDSPVGGRGTASDGGADAEAVTSPPPREDRGTSTDLTDQYCGNCEHFRYVRTDQGMTPYCGLRSEYMDDVEACDDWTPNA